MIYRTSNYGPGIADLRPDGPTAIVHFVLETLKMEGVVCTELLISYSFLCGQNTGPTARLITYSYLFLMSYSGAFFSPWITAVIQHSFEIS
jgi:hypothetical protein